MHTLLKPQDVADCLSMSLPTVYRLIDSGQLPCVKINNVLRIRESDVERLIDANTENRGRAKRNWRTSAVTKGATI